VVLANSEASKAALETLEASACGPSDAHVVRGLEAFGAFGEIELYRLAFVQAAISVLLDGGEVHKHVLAGGPLNEPVALGSVKPLDCTFFSHKPAPFQH